MLSSPLLDLKIEYKNPLKIFNEKNIDLKKLKIMKNTQKSIYLYNISNEKIFLEYEYNKNEIEIKALKQFLESNI